MSCQVPNLNPTCRALDTTSSRKPSGQRCGSSSSTEPGASATYSYSCSFLTSLCCILGKMVLSFLVRFTWSRSHSDAEHPFAAGCTPVGGARPWSWTRTWRGVSPLIVACYRTEDIMKSIHCHLKPCRCVLVYGRDRSDSSSTITLPGQHSPLAKCRSKF